MGGHFFVSAAGEAYSFGGEETAAAAMRIYILLRYERRSFSKSTVTLIAAAGEAMAIGGRKREVYRFQWIGYGDFKAEAYTRSWRRESMDLINDIK